MSKLVYLYAIIGLVNSSIFIYLCDRLYFSWEGLAWTTVAVFSFCALLDLVASLCRRRPPVTFVKTEASPVVRCFIDQMHTPPEPDNRIPIARDFARKMPQIFSNRVISSVPGVVMDVGRDSVAVKIKDVTIDFPMMLFTDKSLLRYGQPVGYEVRERSDGSRYQVFTPREDKEYNPRVEEVKKLLSEIKLR